MTVLFGIPTLSGFDRACNLARQAVAAGAEALIVNNGRESIAASSVIFDEDRIEVVTPTRNLGVAPSWNLILRAAAERDAIVVIANDDIAFGAYAIAELVWRVESYTELGLSHQLLCGPKMHVFSFFAMDARRALAEIGEFDEQFWPAYWEDNDYEHRLRIAGLALEHVPHDVLGFEHDGSRTTRDADPETRAWLKRCYENSRQLYRAKWGGTPPHGELYLEPYNATRLRGDNDR